MREELGLKVGLLYQFHWSSVPFFPVSEITAAKTYDLSLLKAKCRNRVSGKDSNQLD